MRYRPLEELKTLQDLTTFDAVCIGGPLNATLASLGCLPVAAILSLQEKSHLAGAYLRSLPYRMPKHMKYCVSLLTVRHRVYVAWIHESASFAGREGWAVAFDSAVGAIDDGAYPKDGIEQAPFEPGEIVVPRGGFKSDCVTVQRCFHRDGKWWFIPIFGDAAAKECACYVKISEFEIPPELDDAQTTLSSDETTAAVGNVLRDDQIFGPSKFAAVSDPGSGSKTYYGIDLSGISITSMAPKLFANNNAYKNDFADALKNAAQSADMIHANRNVSPFHPGELVRFKHGGGEARVEKTKYLDSEKCWCVRLVGHASPYSAAMLERVPTKPLTPRDVPPAPVADERPRRRVVRKGERK